MLDIFIKLNSGAAVLDTVAAGDDHEPQAKWLKRQGHPDLDEISKFLANFGMEGPKKFLGGAFEVETKEELERAAKISRASSIEDMTSAPGGGKLLTITDPEGYLFNIVWGQQPAQAKTAPEKLPLNYEVEKERVRKFQRFQPGPAAVHKLGYFGYCSTKFDDLVSFYTHNFNIVPLDCIYIFDYWWDTTGNMVEHYTDGDLVNGETPVAYVEAGSESLAVWGPKLPATFMQ
ncbi:hypothetical protein NCS56_00785500 [Fusarium sp. Ph1]|nr:hypothetical protein NCS56_00785500 [Fusarium sp. Ph1]